MQKVIRAYELGVFVKKVHEEAIDGYVINEHEVYKAGREYVATLRVPETGEDTVRGGETDSIPESTATFQTEPLTRHDVSDKTIPDWKKLDKMVREGDKDGIEAYCKPFGITLKKTKSPFNMLKDFKEYVGA